MSVWALVDSGSSVHVVDAPKVFPGAPVAPPPKGHKGFSGAGGERIEHKGTIETAITTMEGTNGCIKWKNANVAMPILSTQELARNGNMLVYDEDHGFIINKKTGQLTKFIAAAGVYFVQLRVRKDVGAELQPPFQGPGGSA